MERRIEDYALLGDLRTAALVSLDGSVDWLCLPRFDSAACFAGLLGGDEHGHWRIRPRGPVTSVSRRYREGSLVLETEFVTATGTVRLVDAMPIGADSSDLVRVVEGVSGSVEMEAVWVLRFGYGRHAPWLRRVEDADGSVALVAVSGPDAVVLRSDVLPRATHDRRHRARFRVEEGQRVRSAMVWYPSWQRRPPPYDIDAALVATDRFWTGWSSSCGFQGRYREPVLRSLITLKALTYDPSGGIVAAATTSLPEVLGGERNWDYRFCWLRDATLTLWALLDAGYPMAAWKWRAWLLRAIAGDPEDLQIMYGAAGERDLQERELAHLPGFAGSQPVRVGNAASEQFQLDVYGEVLNALHQARLAGIPENTFSWSVQRALLTFLEEAWHRADKGLWEVRGPDRHFTHSKVMCWVAFDRAVLAVEQHGLDGPVETWRRLRDEVHAEVLERAWSESKQAFTQYYDGDALDAAVLMLPLLGFLPATNPRMVSTVAAVERELRHGDLVDRYTTQHEGDNVDGLSGREGSFLACSFWLVDNLARAGRTAEAEQMFDRLLELRNDVGLLAEEYDGETGRQAGNFPQAFSHVALVGAAMTLAGHTTPPQAQLPHEMPHELPEELAWVPHGTPPASTPRAPEPESAPVPHPAGPTTTPAVGDTGEDLSTDDGGRADSR